jgi:acyl-coenzyme A synthetase/AMP-(fatty) acid ligase
MNFMDHQTSLIANRISVGKPAAGVSVEIRDDKGAPVTNAAGEMTVSGDSVATGYWDPQFQKVITLRTGFVAVGDVGYRLADGRIFLMGRRDFIVKVQGYRIALTEIERALSKVAGISDAVAIPNRTPTGDTGICAFYVHAGNDPIPTETLQAAIAAFLPSSTLPISFQPVSALPRLAGGKVNRHVLANPAFARQPVTAHVEYRNSTESSLAQLWSDVLGTSTIPRDKDFFAIGGDSITALRVINRVRRDFHVDVAPREFF